MQNVLKKIKKPEESGFRGIIFFKNH